MARHLSTNQLTSWLNGDTDQAKLDEHLNTCDQCADKIEQLNLDNVEPISAEFKPALMAVLQPPADLHERISARIADRLQDRDDASLFGSLLGLPVQTTKLITAPKPAED